MSCATRTVAAVAAVAAVMSVLTGCAASSNARPEPAVADQRPTALQPQRVGPAAMEAWIAPWEDATGDLYPAANVYIAIAPERWEYAASGPSVLRPVQLESRGASDTPSGATTAPVSAPAPIAAPADAAAPALGGAGAMRET